jgi:hypothetical protein
MTLNTDKRPNIYAICRTLPTFSRLSDSSLQEAINASINTYLPDLEAFDHALPAHFHRKSRAAWLEFTVRNRARLEPAGGLLLVPAAGGCDDGTYRFVVQSG